LRRKGGQSANDGAPVGTFRTGTAPFDLAFEDDNVWVTNFYENTVTKLRVSDGRLLGTFQVGHGPAGIAFDGRNLWVANNGSSTVTVVRPSDGSTLATMPVGTGPFGIEIATTMGTPRVWVASAATNSVNLLAAGLVP
jgi:YVTN family beta-propeller protein